MHIETKRVLFILAAATLAAGCLGPAPKAPTYWTVGPIEAKVVCADEPKWEAVRLSRLEVRAPYDAQRLAVLRPDGTIAFDPENSFAAAPAALLGGAAFDVLSASGMASSAVAAHSAATGANLLEVTVTRFALDCRMSGSRKALVALTAVLVDGRKGRVLSATRAEASEDAAHGNYTSAFSSAFAKAMADALKDL